MPDLDSAVSLATQESPCIQSLPNELLSAIFAMGSKCFKMYRFMDLISSVNHHWRDVALNSPDCWSTIYISEDVPCRYIAMYLDRSKSTSLNITIHTNQLISPVAGILVPHITRIGQFTFKSGRIDVLRSWAGYFQYIHAPNLRNLDVEIDEFGDGFRSKHVHFFSAETTPRFVKLRIRRIRALTFANLTSLHIDYLRPSPEGLRDLFTSSPSLSTLVLPEFDVWYDLDPPEPEINAASLRSFATSLRLHSDLRCGCLLTLLSMPNLECLEIVLSEFPDIDVAEHFSVIPPKNLQYPKLHTLRLHGVDASKIHPSFFLAFPNLEILHLSNTINPRSLPIAPSTDALHLRPMDHLRAILLEQSDCNDLSWLYDALDIRKAAGYPLPLLCISRNLKWDNTFISTTIPILHKRVAVEFFNSDSEWLINWNRYGLQLSSDPD